LDYPNIKGSFMALKKHIFPHKKYLSAKDLPKICQKFLFCHLFVIFVI